MRSNHFQQAVISFLAILAPSILAGCAGLDLSHKSASQHYAESLRAREQERKLEESKTRDELAERRREEAATRAKFTATIGAERNGYSPEYVKFAIEILGTCQKAVQSPRVLIGSIHATAVTQLAKLNLDFPQQKSSALSGRLDMLVFDVGLLSEIESAIYGGSAERNIAHRIDGDLNAIRSALLQ